LKPPDFVAVLLLLLLLRALELEFVLLLLLLRGLRPPRRPPRPLDTLAVDWPSFVLLPFVFTLAIAFVVALFRPLRSEIVISSFDSSLKLTSL
jgi:hypothetical protein